MLVCSTATGPSITCSVTCTPALSWYPDNRVWMDTASRAALMIQDRWKPRAAADDQPTGEPVCCRTVGQDVPVIHGLRVRVHQPRQYCRIGEFLFLLSWLDHQIIYLSHAMDLFTLLMLRVTLCDVKFTQILGIIMGYNRITFKETPIHCLYWVISSFD